MTEILKKRGRPKKFLTAHKDTEETSSKYKTRKPKKVKDYGDVSDIYQGNYHIKDPSKVSQDTLRKRHANAMKQYNNQLDSYVDLVKTYLDHKNEDFTKTIRALLDPSNPRSETDRKTALRLIRDTVENGQMFRLHQICTKSLENIFEAVENKNIKVSQWALDRFSELQSRTERENMELKRQSLEMQAENLQLQKEKVELIREQQELDKKNNINNISTITATWASE